MKIAPILMNAAFFRNQSGKKKVCRRGWDLRQTHKMKGILPPQ